MLSRWDIQRYRCTALSLWTDDTSLGDIRAIGLGQEPPIMYISTFLQGRRINEPHKRAFLQPASLPLSHPILISCLFTEPKMPDRLQQGSCRIFVGFLGGMEEDQPQVTVSPPKEHDPHRQTVCPATVRLGHQSLLWNPITAWRIPWRLLPWLRRVCRHRLPTPSLFLGSRDASRRRKQLLCNFHPQTHLRKLCQDTAVGPSLTLTTPHGSDDPTVLIFRLV